MTGRLALLIRHAQSVWNAEGRWQGRADPPLTAEGLQVAQEAAPLLPRIFTQVLSSPLQRAAHTAHALAQELGINAIDSDARLVERHLGSWEGLTKDEAQKAFVDDWTRLATEDIEPPQWESPASAVARAHQALTEAHKQETGPLLVVSHAGPITCLQRHLRGPSTALSNLEGLWAIIEPESITLLGRQCFTTQDASTGLL